MPGSCNLVSRILALRLCLRDWLYYELVRRFIGIPAGHAQEMAKVGIFMGSILSGVLGYLVLRFLTPDVSALERKED